MTNPYSSWETSKHSWGAPDSWGRPISQFKQEARKHEAMQRLQKKELMNSWGQPNTWNNQLSNSGPTVTCSKPSWGNPFGWPKFFGNNSNPQESAKSQQNNNNWGNVPQPNSFANWGNNNPNNSNHTWSSSVNELKGEQFYDFLKQKEIDDQVICILAKEGFNSLQALRGCTQQSLTAKGISLSEVNKLKNL